MKHTCFTTKDDNMGLYKNISKEILWIKIIDARDAAWKSLDPGQEKEIPDNSAKTYVKSKKLKQLKKRKPTVKFEGKDIQTALKQKVKDKLEGKSTSK